MSALIEVCKRLQQARARDRAIDADFKNRTAHTEAVQAHAYDEEITCRNLLSLTKAVSLTEAAIQIVEAFLVFDRLYDRIPEAAESFEMKQDVRAIGRLLFSARQAVEAVAGVTVAQVVDEDYAVDHLDPWPSFSAGAGKGGAS